MVALSSLTSYPSPLTPSQPNASIPAQSNPSPAYLLNQLTQELAIQPNGILTHSHSVVKKLVALGRLALPELTQFWQYAVSQGKRGNLRPALAGLIATEELLEHDVPEAESLYPLISQLDYINDPLLTIYMAGVYGEMQRPEPYGWAVWKLQQDAVRTALLQQHNPFAQPWPDTQKVHEELGKVIMKHQTPGITSIHQLETPQQTRNETPVETGNWTLSPA